MKEAVLNKMNPKERKILEAELQKVYTKQTHSFREAGKAVWNTKRNPRTSGRMHRIRWLLF